MKQAVMTIAMVLTLGLNANAAAQNHRHTPRTELVDTTQQKSALEAYSDTTAADTTDEDYGQTTQVYSDEDVKGVVRQVFADVDGDDIAGMFFVLGICLILFVFFPIILIVGLIWLISRNRREKYKLAQMAVQNGQPIPEQLLKEKQTESTDDEYSKGMRQLFLGIGLMFFLGYTAGEIGFGIGALVFCIGLGKVVIAKTSKRSSSDTTNDNSNPTNIQSYE